MSTRRPRSPRSRFWLLAVVALTLVGAAVALAAWPAGSTMPSATAQTAPAASVPVTPGDGEAVIGAYVANVQSIDPQTNSFVADLYVWLRWTTKGLQPHETLEFTNLHEPANYFTEWTPREEPEPQPDGSEYFVTHYQGAFNSVLSLRDYPFGSDALEIQMEDLQNDTDALRYITEPGSIAIDTEISIPGYRVGTPSIDVEDFVYPTGFGYIDRQTDESYSRTVITIPVARPIATNIFKYLVPIALVIIAAGLIFQVPPSLVEGRIGLAITALLTLVAMQWTATDGLPVNSYLTLLDVLYVLSLAFVLGSLVQALRITWVARDESEERAIAMDERSMKVYLVAYGVAFLVVLAAFLVV